MSDIPGTTRDAIDTQLEWHGQPVRIVDTAGIRRRGRVAAGPAAETVLGASVHCAPSVARTSPSWSSIPSTG